MALERILALSSSGATFRQLSESDTVRVGRIGAESATGPSSVVLETSSGSTATLSSSALALSSGTDITSAGGTANLVDFDEWQNDGNMTIDANSASPTSLAIGNDGAGTFSMTVTGDVTITNDLLVQGTTTSIGGSNTLFADDFIILNSEYTSAAAVDVGLVFNIDPAATSFGIDDITSNVITVTSGDPSAALSVADFILITGNDSQPENNGIFEVGARDATTITIDTTPAEGISQNALTNNAVTEGTVVGIQACVLQCDSTGTFQVAGGTSAPLSFTDLATGAGNSLQQAYNQGQTITLVDSSGDFVITLDDTGTAADVQITDSGGDYLVTDATNNSLDLGSAANAVDIVGTSLVMTGNPTVNGGSGQWTLPGNVDATNGLDVTTAALTTAAGFTVSGGTIDLDPTANMTIDFDAGFDLTITLADNQADAFLIQEGANAYVDVTTTDASEHIDFGNATTNPTFGFLGSGDVSVAAGVNVTGALDVDGATTLDQVSIVTTDGDFAISGSGDIIFTGVEMNFDPTGTYDIAMDATFTHTTTISDDLADAFLIQEGANAYLDITTLNAGAVMNFGNATTNPSYNFLGSGTTIFGGDVDPDASGNDLGNAGARWDAFLVNFDSTGTFAFTGSTFDIDPTADITIDLDSGFDMTITVPDNQADAFLIQQAANAYFDVTTSDGSEHVDFGNATTNPTFDFLGSGQVTIAGNVDADAGVDVSGGALTIANQAITQTTGGQVTFAGNVDADAGVDVEGNFTHATSGTGNIDRAWDFSANVDISAGILDIGSSAALNLRLNAGTPQGSVSGFEGDILFDSSGNDLYINTDAAGGTNWSKMNIETVLPVSTQASSVLRGDGSGDWIEETSFTIDASGNAATTGTLDVDGATTLDQVSINTTDGDFAISGSGDIIFTGVEINLDPTGTYDIAMDDTFTHTTTVSDNLADAFLIQQGANAYLDITTTNASEHVNFGNASTNPSYGFLGSGTATFGGDVDPDSSGNDLGNAGARWDAFLVNFDSTGTFAFTGSTFDVDSTGNVTFDLDPGFDMTITVADNQADAFLVTQNGAPYIDVTTTDASEHVDFGNATTNPSYGFLGSGDATFGNDVLPDASGNNLGSGGARWDAFLVNFDSTGTFAFTGSTFDVDPTGDITIDLDAGFDFTITVADNQADAFLIQQGADNYIDVTTTDASEAINFGNATTNPDFNFDGSGTVAVDGALSVDGVTNLDQTNIVTTDGDFAISGSGDLIFTGVEFNLDPTGTYTLDMDSTFTATTTISDNLDAAYLIKESTNGYFEIDTTNSAETIILGNTSLAPDIDLRGDAIPGTDSAYMLGDFQPSPVLFDDIGSDFVNTIEFGWTNATDTTNTVNAGIVDWVADERYQGARGNDVTVILNDVGATVGVVVDSVVGTTITLKFDSGGAPVTTTDLVGAVNGDADAAELVNATDTSSANLAAGDAGTFASLSGGYGQFGESSESVRFGGAALEPTAANQSTLGTESRPWDQVYSDEYITTFTSSAAITAGAPVYLNGSGLATMADADAESTSFVIGICVDGASGSSETVRVAVGGKVTVNGSLSAGDDAFLSTTAGGVTATAPSGSGDVVKVLGYMISSTVMAIEIEKGVVLA
jgi:hypothetical protein